jgi:hypothetical protein
MQTILVATMLALCKLHTPDQMNQGCTDVSDYMVNCAIQSDKEPKIEKIKQCEQEFAGGKRYDRSKNER